VVEFSFSNIVDQDIKGKKILVRVDINSSIDLSDGSIRSDPRIQAILPTLDALKEAAVVLIAHQSRKGKPDSVSLKVHAEKIQEYLKESGRKVKFVDQWFNEEAKAAIKSLEPGDILLLENIRWWDMETKKGLTLKEAEESELVQNLSPLFDYFVNDAFGAAHRLQVSLVGWPTICAGPVVAKEFETVNKLMKPEHPSVWLVGGAKAWDKFKAIMFNLEIGTIDSVLISGLTATLIFESIGVSTGAVNKKLIADDLEAHGAQIKEVYEKYKENIILPTDLAVDEDGRKCYKVEEVGALNTTTGDLGDESILKYSEILSKARTIVSNGPPGIFEMEVFQKSSFALVDVMAEAGSKGALVVIGGGEMGSVAEMSGKGDAITISSGGGALLRILSGEDVPLAQVLRTKQP